MKKSPKGYQQKLNDEEKRIRPSRNRYCRVGDKVELVFPVNSYMITNETDKSYLVKVDNLLGADRIEPLEKNNPFCVYAFNLPTIFFKQLKKNPQTDMLVISIWKTNNDSVVYTDKVNWERSRRVKDEFMGLVKLNKFPYHALISLIHLKYKIINE